MEFWFWFIIFVLFIMLMNAKSDINRLERQLNELAKRLKTIMPPAETEAEKRPEEEDDAEKQTALQLPPLPQPAAGTSAPLPQKQPRRPQTPDNGDGVNITFLGQKLITWIAGFAAVLGFFYFIRYSDRKRPARSRRAADGRNPRRAAPYRRRLPAALQAKRRQPSANRRSPARRRHCRPLLCRICSGKNLSTGAGKRFFRADVRHHRRFHRPYPYRRRTDDGRSGIDRRFSDSGADGRQQEASPVSALICLSSPPPCCL